MTLKNARRRLEEIGYECERDVAPYKYKARKIGTLPWLHRGTCLEWLIEAVRTEHARKSVTHAA